MSLHELATALAGRSIHRDAEVDLDALPSRATLGLATQASLEPATVIKASLLGFGGPLSADPALAGPSGRWILDRRAIGYQKRKGAWVQACPMCFASDEAPYIRREWRLAFVTECTMHGAPLIDRCPGCGDTLDFLRDTVLTASDLLPLSTCSSCGARISATARPSSSPDLLGWQRSLVAAWHEGWFVGPDLHVMVPLFLDGIYRLQRLLRSSRGRWVLRSLAFPESTGSESAFESLEVQERRVTLHALSRLLKPWPSRLVELGREARLRWSDFTEEQRSRLPFWLELVCRTNFDKTWYQPSSEELASIRTVLRGRGHVVPLTAVREWAGAFVSKRRLSEEPLDLDEPVQLRLWPGLNRSTERELHRIWVRRLLTVLAKYCWRVARRADSRHRGSRNAAPDKVGQASLWPQPFKQRRARRP